MKKILGIAGIIIVAVLVFNHFRPGLRPPGLDVPAQPPTPQEEQFEIAVKQSQTNPEEAIKALAALVDEFPDQDVAAQSLGKIAGIYQQQRRFEEERRTLEELRLRFPNSAAAEQAEIRLWQMNMDRILSPQPDEHSVVHEVQPGDTLFKIAREYNTTVELISRINGLSGPTIRQGRKLKIATNQFTVLVSKADRVLTLSDQNGIIKEYPVGIGANNSTPVGTFKVVNRIVDPVWYKTGAVVPAGSEENILGTRWIGISEPGYGIHGTTDDAPIQQQQTQGCVRMRNEDVEELFDIIPENSIVEIRD